MNEFGKLVSVVGPVADVWFETPPPQHQLLYALSDKNKPVPLRLSPIRGMAGYGVSHWGPQKACTLVSR